MSDLGSRVVYGKQNVPNPLGAFFWVAAFSPDVLAITVPFEVYHATLSGPSGSNVQVWIDTTFYDYTARGDINSWDPAQPMPVRPGQTIFYYWNTAGGVPPKVTIFCRESPPDRAALDNPFTF